VAVTVAVTSAWPAKGRPLPCCDAIGALPNRSRMPEEATVLGFRVVPTAHLLVSGVSER
jgi:hypothetical protein